MLMELSAMRVRSCSSEVADSTETRLAGAVHTSSRWFAESFPRTPLDENRIFNSEITFIFI